MKKLIDGIETIFFGFGLLFKTIWKSKSYIPFIIRWTIRLTFFSMFHAFTYIQIRKEEILKDKKESKSMRSHEIEKRMGFKYPGSGYNEEAWVFQYIAHLTIIMIISCFAYYKFTTFSIIDDEEEIIENYIIN